MKKLYMIGGTMGVGKTTVSKFLAKDLPKCAFVDGDDCWKNGKPKLSPTLEEKAEVIDNICCRLSDCINDDGCENIVFCWVMHQQKIIDAIISKLDTKNKCEVKCISLVTDENSLRERLLKDVKAGKRTEDVVARSIERLPMYKVLKTTKVKTRNKTVQSIADEIKTL